MIGVDKDSDVMGVGKDLGVVGVGKDSGVMGVGKGSGHGTCLSLISFHGMTCRIP